MEALQLGSDGLPEQVTFKAGDVSSSHGRLVDAIQDTGNRGEEVGLQDLSILKQTERIAREITNPAADRHCAELAHSLKAAVSTGSIDEQKNTHLVDMS